MKITINVEIDTENQTDVETIEDLVEILKRLKGNIDDD